jgi:hypothetical protein
LESHPNQSSDDKNTAKESNYILRIRDCKGNVKDTNVSNDELR